MCKSTKLTRYLDLGEVPLANSLLGHPDDGERTYPISLSLCEDCYMSQLDQVVSPAIMFNEYNYHSAISMTFRSHCAEMARHLLKNFYPLQEQGDRQPELLDIASNDSCLLNEFSNQGYFCLGIEPAKNLNRCNPAIHVVRDFWSYKLAHGHGWQKDFIIATNVLAHVDDLHDFLRGVHKALSDKGMFIAEVPYLPNLISKNQFDTIYHEHLSYFLLAPLLRIFRECGLHIFHVEQYSIHGGNIRIYAAKHQYPRYKSVKTTIHFEEERGYYQLATYDRFSERVNRIKNDFHTLLEDISFQGKKVMAYGASAKGISLLNYSGIQKKWLHSIVDDTPNKQGKFTPGTRIPIVDYSHFEAQKPEYILLLAWNFADELINKTKHLGVQYIVPIPNVRVI